jgi:hypothetical protein
MYQTVNNEGNLSRRLRRVQIEAMVRQAEIIRDYLPGDERDREARQHVRSARIERTLGNITAEEESRIFTLLSFVMPRDAAGIHERPPDDARQQAPPEPADQMQPEVACYLGCPACEGGRMQPN